MPWLRGGTVAVTNGSTTVVGTNADFAANSWIGDAFIGPDGASYEIGNVASATVISNIPAYKGRTASSVAYAIMPVQGYPKALADSFNNINRQWGSKLEALGTTGNYEILPLDKGGTGAAANNGAEVFAALGAGGILGEAPYFGGSIDSRTAVPLDVCFIGPSTGGTKPSGVSYGILTTKGAIGNQGSHQELWEVTGATGTTTNTWHRDQYGSGGAWGPWRRRYSNNNILGTVAQTSGAPAGERRKRCAFPEQRGRRRQLSDGLYLDSYGHCDGVCLRLSVGVVGGQRHRTNCNGLGQLLRGGCCFDHAGRLAEYNCCGEMVLMIICLSPQRRDDTLTVSKSGDVLVVNGETFDFSKVGEGDTLPLAAIKSMWFSGDVSRTDGELSLTLLFPNPWNYSPEQAFPVPLKEVPDGAIALPKPLPNNSEIRGVIDWSQLITASMKAKAEVAAHLQAMKTALAVKNSTAVIQISRIQDRINTIGYGIEAGEATPEDEAEQAALMLSLKSWKAYKFALGKVTAQPTWHASPVWPVEPAIPEIEASPMSRTVDQA